MLGKLDDLAIFGGRPEFAQPLYVGRPNIGDRETLLRRFGEMLDRRWLTNDGPFVKELERRVADEAGVRHCIAICNATVALEIAIRALGLRGEVLIPAFTFVATAHALRWQEVTPVFCDVDPATHNIDPDDAAGRITPATSGIIGVHLWGRPCDTARLQDLADAHRLQLMYDAAHAFGCTHGGRPIGGFGRLEVFSFHATKFVNSFEGGAIVTDDDALADKMRLMRNFGFAGFDKVVYLGTNGKMTEPAALMGLTSIEGQEEIVAVNRANHTRYCSRLSGLAGVQPVRYDERERHNQHYVIVEIDGATAGATRDEVLAVLQAENVIARRYFYPGCHRMAPYADEPRYRELRLPATERICDRVLSLPNGQTIGAGEIDRVCALIALVCSNGARIRQQLAQRAAR